MRSPFPSPGVATAPQAIRISPLLLRQVNTKRCPDWEVLAAPAKERPQARLEGSASCCRPLLQPHRSSPIRVHDLFIFIPRHVFASSNLCALLNTHSKKSLFPNSFFLRTPMPHRASRSPPYHLQAIRGAVFFALAMPSQPF